MQLIFINFVLFSSTTSLFLKRQRLTAPPANNETAGKSGATAPAKKKSKKVPTEGGGGGGGGKKPSKPAKPTATTTPSAGTTPGAATVASTGDDGSGGGHATPISSTTTSTATAIANPVGNQTNIAAAASGEIAAIPLEGDNDADAGSTAAATSGHDIAAQQCNGTVLDHACAPSGQIKLSSPDGTGAGKTEEAVAGAGEPSKGGGNGSGSEGEKGVKNGAKPAAAAAPPTMTTWDPTLQLAVSQFEKGARRWWFDWLVGEVVCSLGFCGRRAVRWSGGNPAYVTVVRFGSDKGVFFLPESVVNKVYTLLRPLRISTPALKSLRNLK